MKNELISEFEWDRKSSKLDKYAKEILEDKSFLFDVYEDKYIGSKLITIEENKRIWNEEYFLEQITLLNSNFSRERLLHCLELREYIDGIKNKSTKKIYILLGATVILIVLGIIFLTLLNDTFHIYLKDFYATNFTK
jgi:hypothetical protein